MDEIESKAFMGSGLSFPLRVNTHTGRFVTSDHEENIHESIRLILHTFRGERVMQPEFGAVANDVHFTDLSAEVITNMEEEIRYTLETDEPRVINVSATALRENLGELNVEVSYRIRATNNQFNRVYPFYILEGAGMSAAD